MKKSALLLSAAFVFLSAPAIAQEAAPTPDTDGAYEGDIVVTATRRAERLADVPLAVSAVTSESMQNSGATDIRQLGQVTPSLLVSSTQSEANASARIRGIGTVGDNPGLESSVAVFIDGVYRSRTGSGLNDLGEIDRIEVLRGPQGTLFGRNASAGLINIISKGPEFDFHAKGEVTYGNYDFWRVQGRVTGPITETLAASLDGTWSKRDGFLNLVDTTGAKVGETNDRDRYFVRGQLLFEPSADLSVRIIGDYTHRDESCCGAAYKSTTAFFDPTPGSPGDYAPAPANPIVALQTALGGYFPAGGPYSRNIAITPGRNYFSRAKDWGLSGEVNWNLGGATLTSITAYRNYRSEDGGDMDYTNLDILYRADDGRAYREFKTFTQELRLQGSAFDDRLDWLVGGYYANERLTYSDNVAFGTQYGLYNACAIVFGRINPAIAPAPGIGAPGQPGCLNPVTGVPTLTAAFGGNAAAATAVQGALNALTSVSGTAAQDSVYRQKSDNFALFTHNIFKVTDTLSVTLGLRYTQETKKLETDLTINNAPCLTALGNAQAAAVAGGGAASTPAQLAGAAATLACLLNTNPLLNGANLDQKRSENEFTGTAVISWKPTDELLTYASYSRGYKAGGFNLDRSALGSPTAFGSSAAFTAAAPALQFGAEKVNAFEVGFKYNTRKFSFNAAGFYQKFKNFQLNTFNGVSFVVQNVNGCDANLGTTDQDAAPAGAATGACAPDDVKSGLTSKGVELEASFRPARDVNIGLGYTYTDARFDDDLVGGESGTPLIPELALLPGNRMSNAPEHVVTSSFAWTPELSSSGLSALFYIDARMMSDYNTGSDLFVEKGQDGYVVANARIGLRGPDERWAIEFWGQNIFEQDYDQVAFNSPLQGTGSAGQVALYGGTSSRLYSAFLAEPRTYGVTLRGKF